MAVTYNHITEIGDSFIVKPGTPIVGVDLVFDFVDDVEGVTVDRYFNKEFRYSNDGLTYTDWKAITPGNLQNINIFNNQIFDIEYRYTRAGSDPTGSLIFNSCTLKIIYTPIENPDSYDESFFSDFFDFNDPDVLRWAINVLGKIHDKGIVPDFVERTEDYRTFFGVVTHWFSIVVNYARLYRRVENRYDLLYEFLRQRGIVLSDSHTKEEMDEFMANVFSVFMLRATKFKENPEVQRLINHREGRVFISSLLEDNRRGWNVNNCSPLYKGIGRTLNTSIGFENVYGVRDLDNYPIPSSDLSFCSIYYDGEFDTIRIIPDGNFRGVRANQSHKLTIDPNIPWEVEAIVKLDGTGLVRFGCKLYDDDNNQVDPLSIDTGFADGSEGNFADDIPLASGQMAVLRGIIYRFDEELVSSDDAKLNIGRGHNLKMPVSARYLSVTLQVKGASTTFYIYDLKVRPAVLRAPISFVSLVNPIVAWLENRSSNLSKIQVSRELAEKFTPYNSNLLPIWIDEIGETEFIPLTITQITKLDISCNALNDGSIVINVSGGKPPYEYSLNDMPYQFSNNFEDLTDGIYTPKVRDADGIVTIGSNVIISRPPIIVLNDVNVVDVSVYNGNDGSITVFASGGTSPLIYALKIGSNNWGQYQASNVFTGLIHGNYQVRVSDARSCPPVESGVIEITQPAGLIISNVSKLDTNCFNRDNGMIVITTQLGVDPIQFRLNSGAWVYGNAADPKVKTFAELAAGDYTPWVKDATGYTISGNVINIAPTPKLTIEDALITDATSHGTPTGKIQIVASGGLPSQTKEYSIRILGGSWLAWQTSPLFENLFAGRYNVKVRTTPVCEVVLNRFADVGQPAQTTTQPPLVTIRIIKIGDGSATPGIHFGIDDAFYDGDDVWKAYPGSTIQLWAVDNSPRGYFRHWVIQDVSPNPVDYNYNYRLPAGQSSVLISVSYSDMA